ncbi:MAG: SLC13/DASS family transporter [Bacteroidales bacterium]|nr:SLC13/DASS family transporter [Bacteroidales bacterium]MBQ6879086.1 SLC13/DASS family transporter [Bacteroidales bacterium]
MGTNKLSLKNRIALGIVLALTIFLWAVPTSFFGIEGLTPVMQRTIAIFVFTALMWIIEVIPTWTTSVVSMVIMLLTISNKGFGFTMYEGAGTLVDYKSIMAAFADPVIMLFLGGFVLAIAASKVGLDVILAKVLLKPFGKNPKMVLLGFLFIIGIFSMFMSNTATAAMFLTFLAPVLATLPKDEKGKIGLALAIPIAANLGGMGTPIGTPPNAIALGALQNAGISVTFMDWMVKMVPYVVIMLLLAWVLLLVMFPFKTKAIELKIEGTANASKRDTIIVSITFALTIILWMGEAIFGISSNIVALIPFAVFTATGVFSKDDLKEIDWSVLWMVAGGFALGTALNRTGLASCLINAVPFASWNILAVMIAGGLICWILSNFISNSAAANLIVPILAVVGTALLDDPTASESFIALGGVKSLLVGVAMCASLAMTLPISTPPNALAHSTGIINTKQMAIVGLIMGVVGIALAYLMLVFIGF